MAKFSQYTIFSAEILAGQYQLRSSGKQRSVFFGFIKRRKISPRRQSLRRNDAQLMMAAAAGLILTGFRFWDFYSVGDLFSQIRRPGLLDGVGLKRRVFLYQG